MSPDPGKVPGPAAWIEFAASWSACNGTVLGQISGKQFSSRAEPAEALPPDDAAATDASSRWFIIALDKSLAGETALFVDKPSAVTMAQLLMGDPVDPAVELSADYDDALAELIRQFCGSIAVAMKSVQGEEVPVRLKDVGAPTWSPAAWMRLELSAPDGPTVGIRMAASQELLRSVESSRFNKAAAENPAAQSAPATNQSAPADTEGSGATAPNATPFAEDHAILSSLGMLRDIPLNARLSFGDHLMPLSDVLGCVPGSVLESDRPPETPVELWVEGILAARGDIVIVDGSYGIRVQELCHSEARRSSLSKGTVLSM